jgi:hypothetical protein
MLEDRPGKFVVKVEEAVIGAQVWNVQRVRERPIRRIGVKKLTY